MKQLYISFFLLFSLSTFSQFNGGHSDGFDYSRVIATRLDGNIVTSKVLYVGGNGDGFQSTLNQFSGFMPSYLLYSGGSGDGFSQYIQNDYLLGGTNLTTLYRGSEGDGFDQEITQLLLSGENLNQVFSGGNGDGYSSTLKEILLTGVPTIIMFSGGNGDGYDATLLASQTLLENLTVLFSGGDGDGFSRHILEDYFIAVLPVEWLTFDVRKQDDTVLLLWSTATETDNEKFEVEHSLNGLSFTKINEVPGAGTTLQQQDYESVHENPKRGVNYYRIRQVDFNDQSSFTDIKSVFFEKEDIEVLLYPNPTRDILNVSYSEKLAVNGYSVVNIQGQVVAEYRTDDKLSNDLQIDVTNFASGIFILILERNDGDQIKIKFIKE